MKQLLTKSVVFLLGLLVVLYLNQYVFRSEFPMAIFLTIPLSIIGFIWFPYIKFFKNKE
jgi:ABC-type iron transport system FetAB permease component